MADSSVSIVLYHNKKEQVEKVIYSVLNTNLKIRLFLLDNSTYDDLKSLSNIDNRIEYIFNNANLGFGKAHNIALKKSIEKNIPYHLVLNPDVYFEKGVLEELYNLWKVIKTLAWLCQRYCILMETFSTYANFYLRP